MSRIRILAENVANRIAAGEVVERPASVVKELLENALDAGARSIRVEVESGGKHLIRVMDDGCGMNHDDALLAFERHATSKLRTTDDLLSIATLGFRGEALPSIASVSRLVLETRTPEEEQGTRVEFAGGKLISVKPAGVPPGTSISVADIFYCVPARRKFLKSETTELGHIASLVTHYALAHPDRQFLLKTPTQEILNCAPVEKLADRVYQIFGRQALEELTEIPANEAPVRSAITEPQLEADEAVGDDSRDGIHVAARSAAAESQRHLHFCESAAGARPAAAARHQRGVSQHRAAGRFPGGAAVHRPAIQGSGRERAPREDRGALPASAIRARFHARRAAPRAFAGAADSRISRGARGCGRPRRPAGDAVRETATRSPALGGNGATPTDAPPGPPHAVIPTAFGRGAAISESFELSGAPDRPIPQRFGFDSRRRDRFPAAAICAGCRRACGMAGQ